MPATVDLVIPVYNEEDALPTSVRALSRFLDTALSNPCRIVIADNASTDGTEQVARQLCREDCRVNYFHLPQKGRGRALRAAWMASQADIVAYMDVDLSTDLSHFPELVRALESGYHVAIGSRLSRESRVTRSFKREFISRSYNLLIRAMFFTPFPDAQCGFKALTRHTAQSILPHVENDNWFFDTELLIIAAKRGYRIKSVPVKWDDDPTSTVHIVSTAAEDLKGLIRLRFGGIPRVSAADSHPLDSGSAGE